MPRLLTALIAFSLGGAAALGPDTHWTRVSTEHFVVSGDAPAADIGHVAALAERGDRRLLQHHDAQPRSPSGRARRSDSRPPGPGIPLVGAPLAGPGTVSLAPVVERRRHHVLPRPIANVPTDDFSEASDPAQDFSPPGG